MKLLSNKEIQQVIKIIYNFKAYQHFLDTWKRIECKQLSHKKKKLYENSSDLNQFSRQTKE